MTDPVKQAKSNAYVVIGMSCVLLFGAYNAIVIVADEYDPELLVWMNLALDVALTGLLLLLLMQVARLTEPGGLKTAALVLGPLGVIAGLIKLSARFSSDAGWWTGHFNYALS